MSACKSCGAPIVWVALKPKGRMTPLDAEPVEHGNIVVTRRGFDLIGEVVRDPTLWEADAPDVGPRHLAHFANCPDADEWRTR